MVGDTGTGKDKLGSTWEASSSQKHRLHPYRRKRGKLVAETNWGAMGGFPSTRRQVALKDDLNDSVLNSAGLKLRRQPVVVRSLNYGINQNQNGVIFVKS
jgi:hypothetical protein